MRRREFITLIGGATVAWPLAARAQKSGMPVVAHLAIGTPDDHAGQVAAFRKGLSETGYAEGRNVVVEYRWLESTYEGLTAILDDLLRRRVAVIAIPGSTPVSLAAERAIKTIPIVFGVAENPVTLGLVMSLAQPGGNATGFNFFSIETSAKRLELMHKLRPEAARIAVLINPANVRYAEATSTSLRDAARPLDVKIVFFNATTPAEIDAAFAAMARERTDALFIAGDAYFGSRRVQLATLAARERVPASCGNRDMVQAGLLMSYGTNIADMARHVGIYAGSILNGAKPEDLPVIQATKFEFVINLQTAKSLGIEVSPMLLALTDEVIE
jgi:putative tryptophan/tyrosine transport system substrate-binding protein